MHTPAEVNSGQYKGSREGLTKLNPSTSASLTHVSRLSATLEGDPTKIGPFPPMLTCSATVCLVHLEFGGENRAYPATVDLMEPLALLVIHHRMGKLT